MPYWAHCFHSLSLNICRIPILLRGKETEIHFHKKDTTILVFKIIPLNPLPEKILLNPLPEKIPPNPMSEIIPANLLYRKRTTILLRRFCAGQFS